MMVKKLIALALFASSPVLAFASVIDFEKQWDYGNGDINSYYNGGTAADGTSGANLGVSFVNFSGLSNDSSSTYYSNAPSALGIAYSHTLNPGDQAYINVTNGVDGATQAFAFSYSSYAPVSGAVTVYSGLDLAGTVLATFDLATNSSSAYDTWSQEILKFSGVAHSFDFTPTANLVAFDNINTAAPVPLPGAAWLLGAGLAMIGAVNRRKSAAV